MANRFKVILSLIISKAQSAFIKSKHISDNVLIAYEIIHAIKNKRAGREGYMVVKLDMSKAYDRVEWAYLRAIMRKIGLVMDWIDLVMRCISSVSFEMLVNGYPAKTFFISRIPSPHISLCNRHKTCQ